VLVLFSARAGHPRQRRAGDVDLGITGYDAMAETGGGSTRSLTVHDALGLRRVRAGRRGARRLAEVQTAADLARRAANERLARREPSIRCWSGAS